MKSIESMDDSDAGRIGVARFARAMIRKLERKHAEGRGGWNDRTECTRQELVEMFAAHLKKGDMVDIANFAMMIWNRDNPNG